MAVAADGVSSVVEGVRRKKFALVLLFLQIVFVILYSVLAVYSDDPREQKTSGAAEVDKNHFRSFHAGFQDVHLLIFVGFGLLVAFLKRYTCSGIGYNLLIAAVVLQWGIFVHELVLSRFRGVVINMETLLNGDLCAAAVIVSFGAVLGKLSPLQLLVMAILEVIVYSINRYIGVRLFQAMDVGYSMYVHMFGAYFGLAVSRVIQAQHHVDHPQESRTYQSDSLALLGTLFLWVCFPSFNAAMTPGVFQQRAFINTVLASVACVLVTFIMTALLSKEDKFGLVHLQNCVLSGAVAVGTGAHLLIKPYGALLVGSVAAVISVLGYTHIGPCMMKKMKVHDTRGVHNVHGLPGIFAGVIGIIGAALATTHNYGYELYQAFPAMTPKNTTTDATVQSLINSGDLTYNVGLSAQEMAGMQAATLVVTFVLAIVGGVVTGFFLRLRFWEEVSEEGVFDDKDYWSFEEEGIPAFTVYVPPPPVTTTQGEEATKEETLELKPKEVITEDEDKEDK